MGTKPYHLCRPPKRRTTETCPNHVPRWLIQRTVVFQFREDISTGIPPSPLRISAKRSVRTTHHLHSDSWTNIPPKVNTRIAEPTRYIREVAGSFIRVERPATVPVSVQVELERASRRRQTRRHHATHQLQERHRTFCRMPSLYHTPRLLCLLLAGQLVRGRINLPPYGMHSCSSLSPLIQIFPPYNGKRSSLMSEGSSNLILSKSY